MSTKAKSMKMLQQELINNPCKRTQPKLREDQSLSDVNYSRKVLCSVIVSATKQPCCKNPDRYEKVNFLFLSSFPNVYGVPICNLTLHICTTVC